MIARNNINTFTYTNIFPSSKENNKNTRHTPTEGANLDPNGNKKETAKNGTTTAKNGGKAASGNRKIAEEQIKYTTTHFGQNTQNLFNQSQINFTNSFQSNQSAIEAFNAELTSSNPTNSPFSTDSTSNPNIEYRLDPSITLNAEASQDTGKLKASNDKIQSNIQVAADAGTAAVDAAGASETTAGKIVALMAQVPALVASATALFAAGAATSWMGGAGLALIAKAIVLVVQIGMFLKQAAELFEKRKQEIDEAHAKGEISDEEAKKAHEELKQQEAKLDELKTLYAEGQEILKANPAFTKQALDNGALDQVDQKQDFTTTPFDGSSYTPEALEKLIQDAEGYNQDISQIGFTQTRELAGSQNQAYLNVLYDLQKEQQNSEQASNTNPAVANESLPPSLLFTSGNTSTGQGNGNNGGGQNPQGNPNSQNPNAQNTPPNAPIMAYAPPLNLTA